MEATIYGRAAGLQFGRSQYDRCPHSHCQHPRTHRHRYRRGRRRYHPDVSPTGREKYIANDGFPLAPRSTTYSLLMTTSRQHCCPLSSFTLPLCPPLGTPRTPCRAGNAHVHHLGLRIFLRHRDTRHLLIPIPIPLCFAKQYAVPTHLVCPFLRGLRTSRPSPP